MHQVSGLPIVNTHVHIPPNFCAFDTPTEVISAATNEGVRVVGSSNFYDQHVYHRFASEARAAGILPLFGLEFITLDENLESEGILVNDPANPGRIYLCGKGIDPFKSKSQLATSIAAGIRSGNDSRAAAMVVKIANWFNDHGVPTDLDVSRIAAAVAARNDVPVEYVSLQERHIARAYFEVLAALPADEQIPAYTRIYGAAPLASPADAPAAQAEIRSRLIKAGTPGFVPEVSLSFADAYAYVLEMDGIPTYPIFADGAAQLSPFEYPPAKLAENLIERGVHAAELIPIRNRSRMVLEYVEAFTEAGIVLMAGTEHNTLDKIPLDPFCLDGPMPEVARAAFFDGTCIVAAHQSLIAAGKPGFVDGRGRVVGDRAELAALGAELIGN